MKTKNIEALQLYRQGELTPQKAKELATFTLDEMSEGKRLQAQMHVSETETLFVFVANGICATLHIQEFNPMPMQEGGCAV